MCLDKGYDYDDVRAILEEFGFTAHIKARARRPKRSNGRPASRRGAG
jgi:hypothetical protein